MKVYLLNADPKHPLFYAECVEEPAPAVPARHGRLRSWADRKARALHEKLHKSESRVLVFLRKLWHRLHGLVAPDEPLMRRLRTADVIEVLHPTTLSPERARGLWLGYLATRRRYHWVWLLLNVVMTIPGVLLGPLPGPNVVEYWFIYRAVCHSLSLLGIGKVRRARIETVYEPCEALDVLPEGPDEEWSSTLASRLGLQDDALRDFLRRAGIPRDLARDSTLAGR